jgi:ubiquinone/menaquinone biosynthesis C-methylase UbiE
MQRSFSCCRKEKKTLDARVPQNMIGTLYDSVAPIYDLWGKLTESRARTRAIELAQIVDGQTILEVAVGTGLAFYEIVRLNPNGTNIGVDLSPGMLKRAKKRVSRLSESNYSLYSGTAFDLPVEDESIDTLVNSYMFDLIPFADMQKIITEFRRVLKKDGRLIVVNMTDGERPGSTAYEYIYNFSPKILGGCRGVKLSDKLQQSGFKVQSREYYQQFLFPSEVILAYQ